MRRLIAGGVAIILFCAVMFIALPTTASSLPETSTPPLRGGGTVSRVEGHCSVGVTSPSKTWFLPEGSSAWGFECWLLIQNPNAQEASCSVTYMIEGEGPKTFTKSIPAKSRKSFSMQEDIGNKDASIKVEGNVPVIPERAMYRNNRREGHDSIGTTSPAQDFYLAEGTSAYGFTTYVLVQNPNSEPSDITVTYMTSTGPQPQAPFTMQPNSRKTIRVNDVLPNADFSTKVHGTKPIIAERSMYWDNGTGEACHDSIGVSNPAKNWYLAEGCTSGGFETWILLQNPSSVTALIVLTYMTEDGPMADVPLFLQPNTRQSVNVANTIPDNPGVSTRVTSDQPVIAERSVYWDGRMGGHNSPGASGASKKWYLAEGCTVGYFETWILMQNPGTSPAKVNITYMTDAGPITRSPISLDAGTRKTVNVGETLPECYNVSTEITSTTPIIAERSMYWNNEPPPPSFTSDDYPTAPGLTYIYSQTYPGYDETYSPDGPWTLTAPMEKGPSP